MPAEPGWPPGGLAGIGDEAAGDLAGQLAAITTLGWRSIELRTVDGVALADLDAAGFSRLVRAVRSSGLRVVCLDSRIGNWSSTITAPIEPDLTELRTLGRQCAELGTGYVRIMSYPNAGLPEADWRARVLARIRRLAAEAERAGITLLHENCAGWAARDAERALALVAAADGPALRLLFDIGNGVAHGYHGYDLLAELAPAVAHVHVKDAVTGLGGVTYTLPGDGQARVADCLRLLRAGGYQGALSLEPHLITQPHRGRWAETGHAAGFLAAGRRLNELVGL